MDDSGNTMKQLSLKIQKERIAEFCRQIVEEFHPRQIILFGSHAGGHPHRGSDVDLMVVMPFRGKAAAKSREILDRVAPTMPIDLLVRTPEQVRKRLKWNDFFLREIFTRGRVLYESAHS